MNFWIFILCLRFIKIVLGPFVFLIVMQYFDFNISAFIFQKLLKKKLKKKLLKKKLLKKKLLKKKLLKKPLLKKKKPLIVLGSALG